MATTDESRPAQRFGRYVPKRLLGSEGDYVKVFAAEQAGLDREVELHVLTLPDGADSPFFERFVHETRILASLDHPAIIPVLDQGDVSGRPFFTTPLRERISLSEHLARAGGTLPEGDVIRIGEILTDALRHLHGQGMLHRGISTRSVYYDPDKESPYIAECAVMKDIRYSLSTEGVPKLGHVAPTPELFSGAHFDERTDVFLVCWVLYELLAGKAPVDVEDMASAFPPLEPLRASEEGLDELIMKGLAVDPTDRYATAGELAEALQRIAKRLEVKLIVRESSALCLPPAIQEALARRDAEPEPAAPRPGPMDTRSQWFVGGGVALVLAGLLGVLMFGADPSPLPVAPTTRPMPVPASHRALGTAVALQIDDRLLAMAVAVGKAPTSEKDFDRRIDFFRRWLAANPGGSGTICSYVDVVRLRSRFLRDHDESAFSVLDRWIGKAADLVRERRSRR